MRSNDASHNLLHDETSRMTGGAGRDSQRCSAIMQLQYKKTESWLFNNKHCFLHLKKKGGGGLLPGHILASNPGPVGLSIPAKYTTGTGPSKIRWYGDKGLGLSLKAGINGALRGSGLSGGKASKSFF